MPTTFELAPAAPSRFLVNVVQSARGPVAVLTCIRTHRSDNGGATLWRFLLTTCHHDGAPVVTDITLQLAPPLGRRTVVRRDGVHGVRFVNRGETTASHADTVMTAARDAFVVACGGSITGSRPTGADALALRVDAL